MLRRLLRLFDPRIGIAILVTVVTILVFQYVVGGIASKRLASSESSLKASAASVKTLEESVTLLKESGATNAEQLKGRLQQISAVLPRRLDDVYVTTVFVNIADFSAVTLTKFEPALDSSSTGGAGTVQVLDVPGLVGTTYSFSATGTVSGIMLFVQQIFSSNKVLATLNDASLSVAQGLEAQASVQGNIIIWTDATIETEADAEDTSSTTIPRDSTASTSVPPAMEGSATTLPVPSEGSVITLPSGEATQPTAPPVSAPPVTAPPTTVPTPTTTVP